jgi:tetrapyrrole methylase family protein/MazG family protein/ATP diphosphatase
MDTTSPAAREARVRAPSHPLLRILELVRVLREPGGCPWDREQTVATMTPYLQEETFEVVEAVASGEGAAFREELGDLMFLVLFLAEAGGDDGLGSLEEVAQAVVDKLVRRHPHVFGDGGAIGAQGALQQWEDLKRREKETSAGDEPVSTLGRRPKGLPALTTAFRISEKAGAVGFQWPDVHHAVDKLAEETDELRAELQGEGRREAVEEEIGDLLYSVVNVARYMGVDPERALRATTRKFTRRFHYMERRLHERGKTVSESDLDEMDALWEESKGRV